MTAPSPKPGASHGNRRSDDDDLTHILCPCQLRRPKPRALCGTAIDRIVYDQDDGPPLWCIVCVDIARTASVARRCERCAG